MLLSKKETHLKEKEKIALHQRAATDVNMKLYDEVEILTQNRVKDMVNNELSSVASKSSRRNIFKKNANSRKKPTTARNKVNDVDEL